VPSENLEKLKTELLVARAVIEPQIEGLADFLLLNIKEATKATVQVTHGAFVERHNRITLALDALQSLEGNLYPDTPEISVVQEVYADLAENVSTIAAAFAKFTNEQATNLGVSVGAPEIK